MPDILDQIDAVLADVSSCAFCQSPLRDQGPSQDFCGEVCQWNWYERQGGVKSGIEKRAVEPEAAVEAPPMGERQFREAFAEIAADREAVEAVVAEAFATGGIVTRAPILGVTTPGDPWSDIVDTYQHIRDSQGDRQPFFMPVVEAEAARIEEAIRLELNAYPQRWIPLAPPAPLVDELVEPDRSTPDSFMMATQAHHTLGDISRDAPDLAIIYGETPTAFIGEWATGVGFVNVRFPKATTRPLTAGERQHYGAMSLNGQPLAERLGLNLPGGTR